MLLKEPCTCMSVKVFNCGEDISFAVMEVCPPLSYGVNPQYNIKFTTNTHTQM